MKKCIQLLCQHQHIIRLIKLMAIHTFWYLSCSEAVHANCDCRLLTKYEFTNSATHLSIVNMDDYQLFSFKITHMTTALKFFYCHIHSLICHMEYLPGIIKDVIWSRKVDTYILTILYHFWLH